jgi:excisionase family DNA binding protein
MDRILLPTAEAAAILGIGRTKLYEYLDKPGGIRVIRLGRSVRVHVDDVRAFADRQRGAKNSQGDSRTITGAPVDVD